MTWLESMHVNILRGAVPTHRENAVGSPSTSLGFLVGLHPSTT
eukprot:CAMPEP_0171126806 /NCGR_PEP_ID=MMETSP0766_2-20121228/114019_1 /TAXON_ID=439317 /ORGANISM="Gambierdiscus australes, Strain CAWD 149" /LENGTH=42 /DNA_ID= /DNA_START= /DNA_END= /DNA_ORIENTATION=